MKLKKFITMISVAAFAMTSFAVIPAPVAFADGGAAEETGFFEDFVEFFVSGRECVRVLKSRYGLLSVRFARLFFFF